MARRRRPDTTEAERDDDPIANLLAPIQPAPLLPPATWSTVVDPLTEIEDLRTFDPDPLRQARDFDGRNVNLRTRLRPGPFSRLDPPSFSTPERVLVCVRRKTRREVIFAKKKRRKGAGARRRRRNQFSNVRCT